MTVDLDQIYTINMSSYPWTDVFAKTHSTLTATLLKEEDAKTYLHGYQIKITEPDPPQLLFHQGDKGLTLKWVRGTLQNGPLMYGKVAVAEEWLTPACPRACVCDMNTILSQGCQCGGV